MIVLFFTSGCSSNKQSEDSFPCIDIRKSYPEKEIEWTDIADITYLHTNTEDDDYLYKGNIRYVTENTIVIPDDISGSILFFTKDGNPKSRFNHYGAGPEEYPSKGRDISSIVYDETKDEVFIVYFNNIRVYSSTGEFKRKIILPQGVRPHIIDYDEQSLFVYDNQRQFKKMLREYEPQSIDSSFFLISKKDGSVLDYVIIPHNDKIDLTDRGDGRRVLSNFYSNRKCAAGLLLCNPETDTVFLFKSDKSLIPVFCKKPLVTTDEYPKVILNSFSDVGRYQFITIEKLFDFYDYEVRYNVYVLD